MIRMRLYTWCKPQQLVTFQRRAAWQANSHASILSSALSANSCHTQKISMILLLNCQAYEVGIDMDNIDGFVLLYNTTPVLEDQKL